jgi:hypothetical protein
MSVFFVFSLIFPMLAPASVVVPMQSTDTMPTCISPDRFAIYQYKANCKETLIRKSRKYSTSYNALGLRDKDYAKQPKAGQKRIIISGPSVLAAPGLEEKDIPARAYERALRKKKVNAEVINAGVDGYSMLQNAAKVPELLDAYNPTHFFLLFGNTWVKDSMFAADSIFSENFIQVEDVTSFIHKPNFPQWLRSRLLQGRIMFAYRSIMYMGRRALLARKCLKKESEVDQAECFLESTLKSIEFAKRKVEERNAKFALMTTLERINNTVMIHPNWDLKIAYWLDSKTPQVVITTEALKKLFERRAIPLIVLSPSSFRRTLPDDYHLNEGGSNSLALDLAGKTYIELKK